MCVWMVMYDCYESYVDDLWDDMHEGYMSYIELHEKYELWTMYVTEFIWLLSWPCYDDLCGHCEYDKKWMMYVQWEYDELYLCTEHEKGYVYKWLCI